MERRLEIFIDKQKLVGDLYLPEESVGPFPCVITSHGYKSHRKSEKYIQTGHRLTLEGVAVLTIDHRGALQGESDSAFENTTVSGRIEDLQAAIQVVGQVKEIDPTRLGLMGSSLGGMDTILTQDERIKAKVILSTPFRIPPPSEAMMSSFLEKGYWDYADGSRIRKEFYEDLKKYDVIARIRQEKCPLLIIHGNLDETVPRHHARVLYDNAGSTVKSLHLIDGGDHSLSDLEVMNEALSYAFDWFKKYLI